MTMVCPFRVDIEFEYAVFQTETGSTIQTSAQREHFPECVEDECPYYNYGGCDTCKEYDQENHCCHRWSKVIRNTVEEMKQGNEREVLDKIDGIVTDALDKSTDQKESQTLRWVLDKISEVT